MHRALRRGNCTVSRLKWRRSVTCTVGATTETRRQNTAAQAVVHHGMSVALMNLGSLTFKLYGHIVRREEYYVIKRVTVIELSWKRIRGRPKLKWLDNNHDVG